MIEYEELDPKFKKLIIEKMKTESPYWSLLGMELVDIKEGWAKVRLPFDKKIVHPLGVAHGGAIFSPADSAVAMALIGMVQEDESFATIEMKINYIAPFEKGEIIAEAKLIHKGRNTALGDIEVRNGQGDLIAKALATYMIIKKV